VGQTKGMWRIPDGKVRERSVFMFGGVAFARCYHSVVILLS
jgi:hypothetical protein